MFILLVPIVEIDDKPRITLNAKNWTFDEAFVIDLPAVTLQHGLFRYCQSSQFYSV